MNKKSNKTSAEKQLQLRGIPAAPGIAIGKAYIVGVEEVLPPERSIEASEVDNEIERFKKVLEQTKEEITAVKEKISEEMGVDYGNIFGAHFMVLEDPVIVEEVISKIKKNRKNIESVFSEVLNKYVAVLSNAKDEYLRDRVSDITDVGKRILYNLMGSDTSSMELLNEKSIVISYDLSPSDTAMMHRGRVLGFATDIGGRTSHTAIMAKSLEIPAVVGLENVTDIINHGDMIILDGIRGIIIVNPTKRFIGKYEKEKEQYESMEKGLVELKLLPSETLDGRQIILAGNIELPEDVVSVISHGAEGVGLYRTEYFFMNRKDLPGEEEQFNAYKSVASRIKPNYVTIRTLDVGGDKFLSQLDVPKDMNPFLGWRAIRFCLARPDVFKTQLRAILRASVYGNLRMMYPMISGIEEFMQANSILDEVRSDLRRKNIPFDENMKVGAMIEVPSAALTSNILAKESDFFSIGTNDLIQYSLAVDRVNEKIAYLYEPTHPAVLSLIKMIIVNGHANNIPVGLCGEVSGDISLSILLLGLGLDEFSSSPIAIPEIKQVIRSINYSDAKEIADKALGMQTGTEILNYVKDKLKEMVPDSFITMTGIEEDKPSGPEQMGFRLSKRRRK